jgi:hypothetical protein
MSMPKAYNEDEYDDVEDSVADLHEASIDNTVDDDVIADEVEEDTPNLGADKIFLNGEEISKEEAAEKMEEVHDKVEESNSHISATANPNVFVIDHNNERRVINVEEDDIPYGDMLINKETHTISFADGTIFDYKNLNIMH